MEESSKSRECFPDGTCIPDDLLSDELPDLKELGLLWYLNEHGIKTGETVQTQAIQRIINRAAEIGGGVIVFPRGTVVSGSLFFPKGVHLFLAEGAVLKGSQQISDYPLRETRIEGETCFYFPALINADHADGFTIFGSGTIDGNGLHSWEAFWLRRKWNPACTNKDEQRPRLLYISHSSHVTIHGVTLRDSHFWTMHLYRCHFARILNCRILSPAAPVPAPSTDAVDLDACEDIAIRGCFLSVNDDAIALKGGKGLTADRNPDNGPVQRVLIENCEFGFCHSCLTCGSEAFHCRNILMRHCRIRGATNLLRLKMRPDTPQKYEYINIEEVSGQAAHLLHLRPWTQFADPGAPPAPPSIAERITLRDCACTCDVPLDVAPEKSCVQGKCFLLENLRIRAREKGFPPEQLTGFFPESQCLNLDIRTDPDQHPIQSMEIM